MMMGQRFPFQVVDPGPVMVTRSDVTRMKGCDLEPIPEVELVAFFSLFVVSLKLEYFWVGAGRPWSVDNSELNLTIVTKVPDRDHGRMIELVGSESICACDFKIGRPIGQWIEEVIIGFVHHEAREGVRVNGRRVTEVHPELTVPNRVDGAMMSRGFASR